MKQPIVTSYNFFVINKCKKKIVKSCNFFCGNVSTGLHDMTRKEKLL